MDAPADTGSSEVGKQYDLARRNVVKGVDDVALRQQARGSSLRKAHTANRRPWIGERDDWE